MHLWVGNTPKDLYLYEVDGDTLILPFGTLREILPMIAGAKVYKTFAEPRRVDYSCDIPLYDYQQVAVDEVVKEHYGILKVRQVAARPKWELPLPLGSVAEPYGSLTRRTFLHRV